MSGITSLNLPRTALADEILINRNRSTARVLIEDLALQLMAQPAFSVTAFASVAHFRATLDQLMTVTAAPAVHGAVLSNGPDAGIYERVDDTWLRRAPIPAILTESLSAIETKEARDQVLAITGTLGTLAQLEVIAERGETALDATLAAASSAASYDPTLRFATVQGLLNSERVAAGAGTIWQAAGLFYREADAGAVDQHLTTAGGVKLYVTPVNGMVTPSAFGAVGTGNERTILVAWLDWLAAAAARCGYVDRDYSFATTITHSGAVKIRGPWSDAARLIYTGTGDGLVLTGAVDLDGVIVDGNLSTAATPTVTSEAGCLIGIHGPLTGTPGYLTGVKIGRLRAQNTRRRTGLALVNLKHFEVDHIGAVRCYGHGLHFAGLRAGTVKSYFWSRVGNLAQTGSRLGAGMAFFIESDLSKRPAEWYEADGIQDTINVNFGPGGGEFATDSAWYCHNLNGAGRSFKDVSFGPIRVANAGKDGAKMRGVENVIVNGGTVNGAALRLFVIEEGCVNSGFLNVAGQHSGRDVIGLWLDGAEGTKHFKPDTESGYTNGEGQSLNNTPAGALIAGSFGCFITGDIQHIRAAPYNGIEGSGISMRSSTDCRMIIAMKDVDALARVGAVVRCYLDLICIDMARATATTTAFFYCDDSDGSSVDSTLRLQCMETGLVSKSSYPCRINGTGTGWDIRVGYRGVFGLPGGIVTRSDAAEIKHYSPPPTFARRETIAFDVSSTAVIAHGLPSAPAVSAMTEGGLPIEVAITAVDNTNVTLRLHRSDDSTADTNIDGYPSVSRTIHLLMTPIKHATGYQW